MNIFELPVYYISFKKQNRLETDWHNLGFSNINHFHAIDGRKFKPDDLLAKNLITTRAYRDLIYGRHEHAGLSSLGAVGCTMSHNALWELCANKSFPYIVILEDDVKNPNNISQENQDKINKILSKPNSIYVSSNINKEKNISFFGTSFLYNF